MYTIAKTFDFAAAHVLEHLPDTHPCSHMHGHNYVVVVECQSESLEPATDFVVDYRRLGFVKEWLDATFDHRCLNDVMPNWPTAENIAHDLYDIFHETEPLVSAVRVSETGKTWAEYRA
jgi:6-pyruvoyltetrahydropterin/6-carboxytetrahydropterin synthase